MFFFFFCSWFSYTIIPHSSNRDDFIDDSDQGRDLDNLDFEELNKIGQEWEASFEQEDKVFAEDNGEAEPAGVEGASQSG